MPKVTSRDRPLSVTITFWGVIAFGVWNLGRGLAIWQQRALPQSLEVQPDPFFRLVLAVVWAVCFGGLAVALWQQRPFTRLLIPILFIVYALAELAQFVWLMPSPLNRQAWQLPASIFSTAVLFSSWALNCKAAQTYFHKGETRDENVTRNP